MWQEDLASSRPPLPGGGTYELRLPEDAREETASYHPVPCLWCSVHGSEHEPDEAGEEEEPEIEPVPVPIPLRPSGPLRSGGPMR